ncbi:MAG: hypothetical protein NTX03_09215 [Bacteroidetes bacterium]|nr:hypothetical protein [Bacteroidota bacterium]
MDSRERSKMDSYARIQNVNATHPADITEIAVPGYPFEKTNFDNAVSALKADFLVQGTPGGSAEASALALLLMGKTVVKYAKRGAVKARQIGNTGLAEGLGIPLTDITKATKAGAITVAKNIRKLLNDNLATLTNIIAANITEIDNTITAYDNIKDKPTEVQQVRKADGTDLLEAQFVIADLAANNMLDLLESYYEDTPKQALVNEMELAKQLITTGVRHTKVQFTVLANENNEPLENATALDISNGKVYHANMDGVITIEKHKPGKFHFTVACVGKTSKDVIVDVKRGMNNEVGVRLV